MEFLKDILLQLKSVALSNSDAGLCAVVKQISEMKCHKIIKSEIILHFVHLRDRLHFRSYGVLI